MPNSCAYCGQEEDLSRDFALSKCPVCGAFHCPLCGALIEFAEPCGANDAGEELVDVFRAPVCKVHLPWNIIEGIKKDKKEDKNE